MKSPAVASLILASLSFNAFALPESQPQPLLGELRSSQVEEQQLSPVQPLAEGGAERLIIVGLPPMAPSVSAVSGLSRAVPSVSATAASPKVAPSACCARARPEPLMNRQAARISRAEARA